MDFDPQRLDEFSTIRDLADAYPQILSEHQLRHLARARHTNGLGACCVMVGKQLLIWRPGFVAWIKAQHEAQTGETSEAA